MPAIGHGYNSLSQCQRKTNNVKVQFGSRSQEGRNRIGAFAWSIGFAGTPYVLLTYIITESIQDLHLHTCGIEGVVFFPRNLYTL